MIGDKSSVLSTLSLDAGAPKTWPQDSERLCSVETLHIVALAGFDEQLFSDFAKKMPALKQLRVDALFGAEELLLKLPSVIPRLRGLEMGRLRLLQPAKEDQRHQPPRLGALRQLSLQDAYLAAEDLEGLCAPSLQTLRLEGVGIQRGSKCYRVVAEDLYFLSKLADIETLSLSNNSELGISLLPILAKMEALARLNLQGTNVKPSDMNSAGGQLRERLIELHLSAASCHDRFAAQIEQEALLAVRCFEKLESLSYGGRQLFTLRQIMRDDVAWQQHMLDSFKLLAASTRQKLRCIHPRQGWDEEALLEFFQRSPIDLVGNQKEKFRDDELLALVEINPRAKGLTLQLEQPTARFLEQLTSRLPMLQHLVLRSSTIASIDPPRVELRAANEPRRGLFGFSRRKARQASEPPAPTPESSKTLGGLLGKLAGLRQLEILDSAIESEELCSLARCRGLRSLSLGRLELLCDGHASPMHPEKLAWAAGLLELEQFDLDVSNHPGLDKTSTVDLHRLHPLTRLNLSNTQFTTWDVAALFAHGNLKHLESVRWTRDAFEPQAAEALQRSQRLSELWEGGRRIYTQKNIEDDQLWREASLQAAERLSSGSLQILQRLFPDVKAQTRAEWAEQLMQQEGLCLAVKDGVVPLSCQHLREIIAVNRRLRSLEFAPSSWDPSLCATIGRLLGRLQKLSILGVAMEVKPPSLFEDFGPGLIRGLKELNLPAMRLTSQDLAQVGACTDLEALSLLSAELTPAPEGQQLAALGQLTKLRRLMLNGSSVTAIELTELAPRLEWLFWSGTRRDPKEQQALSSILESRTLQRVEFRATALSSRNLKLRINALNKQFPCGAKDERKFSRWQLATTEQTLCGLIDKSGLSVLHVPLKLAVCRIGELHKLNTKIYGLKLDASLHTCVVTGLSWHWLHYSIALDSFGDSSEKNSVLETTLLGVKLRVSWKALPDVDGNQGLQRQDFVQMDDGLMGGLLKKLEGDLTRLLQKHSCADSAWQSPSPNKHWGQLRYAWDPAAKQLVLSR